MPSPPILRLDTRFLRDALDADCFVASAYAPIVADPFAFGILESAPVIRFVFSDIPDTEFREPSAILIKSYLRPEGSKS